MPDNITVTGATAASGTLYYVAWQGASIACIPKAAMKVGSNAFVDLLNEAGITLFDNKQRSEFINLAKTVAEFPPTAIAERIGWNGNTYAIADGTVCSPQPCQTVLAFTPVRSRIERVGDLEDWLPGVADLLTGTVLGELVVTIQFLSPVLKFMPDVKNFGVVLVAPAGKGKTSLLEYASSVIGQVTNGQNTPYWLSLYATDNSLEDDMQEHRDHPLLLDDFSRMSAGQSREGRSAALTKLSYLLEGGRVKGRKGEKRIEPCRFVALVTANEGMLDLIDQLNENDVAAADRLLTIKVPEDWKEGVFEHVPDGFADGPALSHAIMRGARASHGVAYPCFIEQLVKLAAEDEEALCNRLESDIAEFISRSGGNVSQGTDYRVARSFGAIYAAGRLAKEFGALPKSFKPGRTALEAYRLHLAQRVVRKSFAQILNDLVEHPDVLDVSDAKPGKALSKAANAALGTLRRKRDGLELRIDPSKIELAIPNWQRIKGNAEVRRALIRNNEAHLARKSQLAPEMPKVRLFCFRVPNVPAANAD